MSAASDVSTGAAHGELLPRPGSWPHVESGGKFGVVFEKVGPGWFELNCTDRLGNRRSVWIHFSPELVFSVRAPGDPPLLTSDERERWLRQ